MIEAFVQRTAGLPWEWGRQDCTLWVADWCVDRWGVDPAAAFRDRYSTAREAAALTADGLIGVVAPSLDAFLARTDAPQTGDVGVIEVEGRQVAAIRWSDREWAFRTPMGVGFIDTAAVAAWEG